MSYYNITELLRHPCGSRDTYLCVVVTPNQHVTIYSKGGKLFGNFIRCAKCKHELFDGPKEARPNCSKVW